MRKLANLHIISLPILKSDLCHSRSVVSSHISIKNLFPCFNLIKIFHISAYRFRHASLEKWGGFVLRCQLLTLPSIVRTLKCSKWNAESLSEGVSESHIQTLLLLFLYDVWVFVILEDAQKSKHLHTPSIWLCSGKTTCFLLLWCWFNSLILYYISCCSSSKNIK